MKRTDPAPSSPLAADPGGVSEWQPRRRCSGCERPLAVCLCAALSRAAIRTRVVILQHPREADVPIGTARIAELALDRVERHVGVEFAQVGRVRELLNDPEAAPVLLYPGPGALDLREHPPAGPVTLVVIDGTWWQSQKVLKKNPELAALPRYGIDPPAPSRYRIRREPALHCVSTIEAIGYALVALGEDPALLERLLAPFDTMVEHQLRFARDTRARRHLARPRTATPRRFPAALTDDMGELVVGYAETNAWPRGTPLGEGSEVVHLAAERVQSGERFEAFIAPRRELSPSFAHHTGISRERVLGGEAFDDFRLRWEAFLRPGDVLGSWGVFWSEALCREGLRLPERLDLRLLARRALGQKTGEVEACAEKLGERPPPEFAPGRTGRRLAHLLAVVHGLRRLAGANEPP